MRGVDRDEDESDKRDEQRVDERGHESLRIGAELHERAERLARALVLEHLVRQRERVLHAVGIDVRAEALGDRVQIVILEILRDARDESRADREQEQEADALEELRERVAVEFRREIIDDMLEDERIEQRERLIDRREQDDDGAELPVFPEIREKKVHG